MNTENERREHARVPCNQPVVIKNNSLKTFGTMTDFSRHGIGFTIPNTINNDALIEVNFNIPFNDNFQSFTFKATVQHCIDCVYENHIGVTLKIEGKQYSDIVEKIIAA